MRSRRRGWRRVQRLVTVSQILKSVAFGNVQFCFGAIIDIYLHNLHKGKIVWLKTIFIWLQDSNGSGNPDHNNPRSSGNPNQSNPKSSGNSNHSNPKKILTTLIIITKNVLSTLIIITQKVLATVIIVSKKTY